MARLHALKELDLSGNQIASVHPSIARADSLTSLNFENNMLTTLPDEMGHMAGDYLSTFQLNLSRFCS